METKLLINAFGNANFDRVSEVVRVMDNEEAIRKRLASIYNNGSHTSFVDVSHTGIERTGGVSINYRYYLKKILVKQYDRWQEYYAPNKTTLRKCLYGNIQSMLYLDK